jgi:hypothetical protein
MSGKLAMIRSEASAQRLSGNDVLDAFLKGQDLSGEPGQRWAWQGPIVPCLDCHVVEGATDGLPKVGQDDQALRPPRGRTDPR